MTTCFNYEEARDVLMSSHTKLSREIEGRILPRVILSFNGGELDGQVFDSCHACEKPMIPEKMECMFHGRKSFLEFLANLDDAVVGFHWLYKSPPAGIQREWLPDFPRCGDLHYVIKHRIEAHNAIILVAEEVP